MKLNMTTALNKGGFLIPVCNQLHLILTCIVRTNDITNGFIKPNVNLQCLFAIIADFKHKLCKNSRFL